MGKAEVKCGKVKGEKGQIGGLGNGGLKTEGGSCRGYPVTICDRMIRIVWLVDSYGFAVAICDFKRG
jgi:hypothetical protein